MTREIAVSIDARNTPDQLSHLDEILCEINEEKCQLQIIFLLLILCVLQPPLKIYLLVVKLLQHFLLLFVLQKFGLILDFFLVCVVEGDHVPH